MGSMRDGFHTSCRFICTQEMIHMEKMELRVEEDGFNLLSFYSLLLFSYRVPTINDQDYNPLNNVSIL